MKHVTMRHLLAVCLLFGFGLMSSSSAWAQAGVRFLVTSCSITVNNLVFGVYEPTLASDINTSVSASCSMNRVGQGVPNPPVTVSLGAGGSNTALQRTMSRAGGSGTLNYNLYTGSDYQTIWGAGAAGSSTPAVTKTFSPANTQTQSLSLTFDIFGRIPAQQLNVIPGTYSDTVSVLVDW
ncbi:MAG: spore coat U domain-containing protein [Burkholderiaceae bacterium]